ncbi:MAG TPA: YciI family protein [Vicinamibacterales bacterium]|jgi:hypothetical protein|nr:YciI family protein [Vicinamibacterales bacterium]
MNEFIYLYRRPTRAPGSPQQMQGTMDRWQAWFKDLEKKGHLVSIGQPLDEKSSAVVTNGKGTFNDGPYAETKDIVGGYSVVKATDLPEAIALTKGHPIFDAGGIIEVRPIAKM